ncbi:hypothetical protein AB0M36_24265 [Actinoplanes sp. NPDC051346]|uniref:hypothetical protein n=1 Tax=Actinoplanes sp. NPDC051346 TaxID=3155048 RepID=UPI00343C0B60
MIRFRRHSRQPVAAPEEPPALPAIREAVEAASHGGWEQAAHLAELLAQLATTGDVARGRAALKELTSRPRAMVRLDDHARPAWWYEVRQTPLAEQCAARAAAGAVNAPVAVALASTHGDGHVRERAVVAMLAAPTVELMPFLVLRTSDWVRPVRDRARAGLALLLADDPDTYLPAMLGVTTAIDQRWRGTFAAAQATAALSTASPALRRTLAALSTASPAQRRTLAALSTASPAQRRTLAALPHPASRRFVCDLGLSWNWWSPEELIDLAESGPDVRIRARAAEAACRDAVWRRRQTVLHRLAGSRRPEVRIVALTGLVRTGSDADVVTHLDDPASLARALARDAARRTGVDALAKYRDAVLTAPTAPVIAGFAETASSNDAPLLHPLLSHPQAKVRAATVRALRHLDAVDAARIVPLLRDPSAVVVREAVAALRPIANTVPADLPWELLADPRAALRRAGYRLLTPGPARTCLRAGLIAAADPDPRLALRGRTDVARLALDATEAARPYKLLPHLDLTAEEHADFTALFRRAEPALAPDTVAGLTNWLTATTAA